MADASVVLINRIPGRQTFGYPVITAGGLILGATIEATSYIQNASGQGDLVWRGAEFGLSAPPSGGLTANVWDVSVTVTHAVSDLTDFSGVTAQLYNDATPVGAPVAFTLSETLIAETVNLTTGFPAAGLPDLAIGLSYHAVAPGIAYVSHAFADVSYSYSDSAGMIGIAPVAQMPAATLDVSLLPVMLVSPGPVVTSLSPAFGQSTTAGNLLIAWVFSNDGALTFPTTCSDPSWLLAGHAGAEFGWESLWCKPDCGAHETAPVFHDGATTPLSELLEFSGARDLDQVGGSTGTPDVTYTAAGADTASGDLVFGFVAWHGTNPGPAEISLTGADSSGVPLALSVASNASSGGTQFWVTGWAQASAAAGPGADTMTGTFGFFAGGGGLMASFRATPGASLPAGTFATVPGVAMRHAPATIVFRAGRR